jgi:hypothetical protein
VFCSLKLKQGFCLSQLSDMSSVPFLCINFEWIQSRKHQRTIHMFDLVHHMIWSKQYIYQFLMEVLFFFAGTEKRRSMQSLQRKHMHPSSPPTTSFSVERGNFFWKNPKVWFLIPQSTLVCSGFTFQHLYHAVATALCIVYWWQLLSYTQSILI